MSCEDWGSHTPECLCGCGPAVWVEKSGPGYPHGGYWECPKRVREKGRRRDARRQLIVEERGRRGDACEQCGSPGPLHWHHRDPSDKRFNVSAAAGTWNYGLTALRAELAKCDLLCVTCHRGEHGCPPGCGCQKAPASTAQLS